jgi:hypothetical protein
LAFSSLQKNGMFFILCVMGLVVASNFINLMLSGFVGFYLIPLTSNTSYIPVTDATKIILPIFHFNYILFFRIPPHYWAE